MSLLLKALAVKFLAGRTVGGAFTLLFAVLAPVAGILKFIGLPLLLVLGVVGAPVFLLLGAIGLPALLVVGIGGVIVALVGILLVVGFTLLKIALPIILVVWFVRWIMRPRPPRLVPPVSSADAA